MLDLKNVTLFGLDNVHPALLNKAAGVCLTYAEFGDLLLLTEETNINSVKDYSKFMIKELHKYIHTDYVLVIQYDGFILNPESWTNDFFNYDYIGAPWVSKQFANPIGNGGFSLRSKKLLEEVSQLKGNYHPEDLSICNLNYDILLDKGFKFAPYEVGAKFSFESNYERGSMWNNQFGFHDLRITNISNWNDKTRFGY